MYQENEIVMLALGCGVLLFALRQRAQLRRLPFWTLLFCAFCLQFVAWTSTVLEGFFLPGFLNVLEHTAQAVAAVLIACWCWLAVARRRSDEAGC